MRALSLFDNYKLESFAGTFILPLSSVHAVETDPPPAQPDIPCLSALSITPAEEVYRHLHEPYVKSLDVVMVSARPSF